LAKKQTSFNVHGVLYIEDSPHISPVEHEIRKLSSGIKGVKDEQEYIVIRERVHRNSECGVFISGKQGCTDGGGADGVG
jgi:p24 family protein beta-1